MYSAAAARTRLRPRERACAAIHSLSGARRRHRAPTLPCLDRARTAETTRVKPLCLALSGRGVHAAAHCGVLRALGREGIEVAGVAAVSAASLIAAAWAGGADMDGLVARAAQLHPWMWVRGWGGGLLSGSRLGALIDESLPVAQDRETEGAAGASWRPTSTPASPVSVSEGGVRNHARVVRPPPFFPPFPVEQLSAVGTAACRRCDRPPRAEDDHVHGACSRSLRRRSRWPGADPFVAITLRARLTMLRGAARAELAGADDHLHPQDQRLPAGCAHTCRIAEAGRRSRSPLRSWSRL